jgi:hypothetical protein
MSGRGRGAFGLALFLVNGIVLVNACLHDPEVGYDAKQHLAYVETLAQGRLPLSTDTREFFSPPLPYAVPALLMKAASMDLWWAAKCGQVLQACLSLALTLLLWPLCEALGSDKTRPAAALGVLALLPVYFKSFAFVRGEPFVAFFAVLAVLLALRVFAGDRARPGTVVGLGATLGLLVLSRQWGFLVIGGLVVFVALLAPRRGSRRGAALLGRLGVALGVATLVGGGFYLHLLQRHGRMTAFNRPASRDFSPANQPPAFYLGSGLPDLFLRPVADAFPNQLLPIFYSETFGDYWGFFVVQSRDARTGRPVTGRQRAEALVSRPEWFETNRDRVVGYLGRVNIAALAPALLLAGGLGLGALSLARFARAGDLEEAPAAFLTLVILVSLAGYLAFLIAYPNLERGDTIKATYMLHVFPLAAVLGARALARLEERSRSAYRLSLFVLGVAFAHNLPALVTRNVFLGP